MSNAKLDLVFDQYIQNMIDASGEDAVNRARDLLKENDLLWWDYWDYQDYGHLTRDDALSIFQEVDRILNKSTKKSQSLMKDDEVEIEWEYGMPVIEFIRDYNLPLQYYIIISGTGFPGTVVGSYKDPLPEKYYNCPVVSVAVSEFMGKFVEVYIDVKDYEASTKKSQPAKKSKPQPTFSEMVQKQRNKNKGIKKDISEIESLVQDIEEMKRKAKEVEEKMFAIDWNEYNMQAFPTKIADVYRALDTISDGLYIQFLM